MGINEDITNKVEEYLDAEYDISELDHIPSVEEVPFGNYAKKIKMCVFYIDLRKSTDLLFSHQRLTAGKIHKSFLYTVSKIVNYFGGYIRSFNGDSLLAFWPANYKSEITSCVRAAMTTKFMLDIELKPKFNKYEELDFGIGIDWGEVYIVRAGLPRDPNKNDLIFLGKCVNFAVAIGEQAKSPNHVEISVNTYNNLEDGGIFSNINDISVDIWKDGVMTWQGQSYSTKLTSWYWKI